MPKIYLSKMQINLTKHDKIAIVVLAAIALVIKTWRDRRWCLALVVICLAAGFLNPDYAYIIFVSAVVYIVIASLTR